MFKIISLYFSLAVVFVGLLSGCTETSQQANDPKHRLTDYISKSFSVKEAAEKNQLLEFLTGEAKSRLVSWSDDQFREAFIDSKRQFEKLSFRDVKTISPIEVQITYELTYVDQGKGRNGRTHEAKVTNRKLCRLIFEQEKWLISDVRNIKELVEFQDELSLP